MSKTISWKDDGGRNCMISIQDGSSGTTSWVAGREPFVTSVDDGDDIFMPIRTSTGSIGVVVDGVDDIVSLVGRTPISTYVTLTVGGNVRWVGFLACESFSQEWDKGPLEISLPVVSGLEVLKGIRVPYTGLGDLGYVNFAQFLCAMNEALGNIYQRFYFPNVSVPKTTLKYKMRMSNYATAEDKNTTYEMATFYDVLEDVCRLFGWQVVEYGVYLVFLCADVKKLDSNGRNGIYFTRLQFVHFANDETYTNGTAAFNGIVPEFFGVDHRRSFVAGKNAVDVVGEIHEMDEDIWSMDVVEQCVYKGYETATRTMESYAIKKFATYKASGVNYANGNIRVYNSMTNLYADTEHGYNIKFENYRSNAGVYGGCVSYERFYKYDTTHVRTEGDSDFVMRLIVKGINATLTEAVDIYTNFYYTPNQNTTDKFYIKGEVLTANAADDVFDKTTGMVYLRGYFKIGNKYYNGSSWTTTETNMIIVVKEGEIHAFGRSTGSSFSWYTYIPAPTDVSGEVVFGLYGTTTTDYGPGDEYVAIEDLKIQLKTTNNKRGGVYIETRNIRKDVNEDRVVMNNGFSEDFEQTCGLTLAREAVPSSNGVVLSSTLTLPSSLYDGKWPEKAMCDRVSDYAAKARMVLFAVVKGSGNMLSPTEYYRMVSGGRPWICLCQSVNWKSGEVKAGFFEPAYESV